MPAMAIHRWCLGEATTRDVRMLHVRRPSISRIDSRYIELLYLGTIPEASRVLAWQPAVLLRAPQLLPAARRLRRSSRTPSDGRIAILCCATPLSRAP